MKLTHTQDGPLPLKDKKIQTYLRPILSENTVSQYLLMYKC